MTSNTLAVVTFSCSAALAVNFIFGHASASGFLDELSRAYCLDDTSLYRLAYTGFTSIDKPLCGIVASFHESFGDLSQPFLTYFLISALPVLAHCYFDSYRPNIPIVVAFPLIFAQGMQLFSFGAIFSIYWMVSVLSGATRLASPSTVSKAHAQAVFFGIFIGMFVLTACLLVMHDPYITAIWQIFPALVSLASYMHLLVRPPSAYPESGFKIIQAFYIACFVLISSLHISMLSSKSMEELKALLLPSINVLPASTSLEVHMLNLLQWDAVFGLSASLLGTLWWGRSTKEVTALFVWSLFASPLVGPGAVFAASALWREARLHKDIKIHKTS